MVTLDLSRTRRMAKEIVRRLRERAQQAEEQRAGRDTLVIHHPPPKPSTPPSNHELKPSTSPARAPFTQTPARTPRYRSPPQHRTPLITESAFNEALRDYARRLGTYLHLGHSRSVRLDRDTLTELGPEAAMFLYANNAEARINYARIMADHLERATAPMVAEGPVFWVTLILGQYTVREDEAATFEVKRLQRWVHQALHGCDFVGMVEAALFTNLDVVGAGYVRAVSWHTHALVWGVIPERILAIRDGVNVKSRTVVPGITAAHVRPMSPGEVAGQAFYMCKGQISEYRVWPDKKTVPHLDTGQPVKQPTGRFWVRKRPIRTGDLARMCTVFKGRYLNELSFAGGAGGAVRRAINAEALAAYERSQAAERARRSR